MNIGIDIDDVLAEYQREFLLYYKSLTGKTKRYEDMNTDRYNIALNESDELVYDLVHGFYKTNAFKTLNTVIQAQETIKKLSINNNLYIITARPEYTREDTQKWLNKYFLNTYKELFLTDFKSKKEEICNNLNITHMIDDSAHHLASFKNPEIIFHLFDRPWNQEAKSTIEYIRHKNWNSIFKTISTMKTS